MSDMNADTNKVYRKKYFMDADKVVFSDREAKAANLDDQVNALIDAREVVLDSAPVLITHGLDIPQNSIQVEVLKNGPRVEQLNITCPCGRHTEINIEYQQKT
jgi:hypothetical protein